MAIQNNNFLSTVFLNLAYPKHKRISAIAAIACSSVAFLSPVALALSQEELYILCSRYPRNSNCTDYEVPVALSEREGTSGECKLSIEEQATRGRCKVKVTQESVTAYIESGKKLSLLEGEQATKTVEIKTNTIDNLSYETDLAPLNATELNVAQALQVIGMGMQIAGGSMPSSPYVDPGGSTASRLTVQFRAAKTNSTQAEALSVEESMESFVSMDGRGASNIEAAADELEEDLESEVYTSRRTVNSNQLSFKSSPQRERQIRESIQRITGLIPQLQLQDNKKAQ